MKSKSGEANQPCDEYLMAWEVHEQLEQCKSEIQRWERLEQNAPTPSEAITAEHKLAGLRAELAGLLSQLSDATQEHPHATASQPQAAPNPAPASAEQVEPVTRSAAQEAVILETIRRVGHEPLSLPKNEAGKRGIKAAVRDELVAKHKLFPKDGRQFDKAWERLRAFKEIADGD